jgi:hypothetical protein
MTLTPSQNRWSTNIIKKIVGENKSWVSQLKYSLWVDRITKKDSTRKSPFELVYGMDVTLPIHLKLPMYKIMQQFSTGAEAMQGRINQLIELNETRTCI